MITRVLALSYGQMKELASDRKVVAGNCFISITGSIPMAVFSKNCKNIVTLLFDDIYSSDILRYAGFAGVLFRDIQADKIIEFVHYHRNTPANKILYVNCAAGVSRSGAVAAFVNQILCLDERKFRSDNPRISPNVHVAQVLKERWQNYGRHLKPTDLRTPWID